MVGWSQLKLWNKILSFGLKNQGTNFGLQSEAGYPKKECVREGKLQIVSVSFAQTLADPRTMHAQGQPIAAQLRIKKTELRCKLMSRRQNLQFEFNQINWLLKTTTTTLQKNITESSLYNMTFKTSGYFHKLLNIQRNRKMWPTLWRKDSPLRSILKWPDVEICKQRFLKCLL